MYNIAITLGAYVLGPRMGIMGMAVGTVAGAVANFLMQVPFVAPGPAAARGASN